MAKDLVKKNQSSMQVLKTLLVLLEGNYTMQELVVPSFPAIPNLKIP